MMTVIGWYGGEALSLFMRGFNHWIAAGILFFLGAKMFVESSGAEKRAQECDPTRGSSLVALSVATSIDALAVGVSFSLMGLNVWKPALFIGLAAAAMTFVGMEIGKTAGGLLGKWAERAGGAVLVAIGARILFEHLAR
jgi:putative Mn2+ efflux pump MntP